MEEVQSLLASALDSLDTGAGSGVECPGTTVIMVHGLQGPYQEHIHWKENWLPQAANIRSVGFSPSDIIGEEASESGLEIAAKGILDALHKEKSYDRGSLTFWAQDIGGTVIKLALLIAAQNEKYQHIIEKTSLVVFFGTPHRSSNSQRLDSAILGVIETCSRELSGIHLPRLLNLLSRQHEDIAQRFSRISHRFGIVNYYQASPSMQPSQVLVSEQCATLSLDNEVKICRTRSHQDLPNYMTEAEASLLRQYIISTRIAFWRPFTRFVELISLGTYRHDPTHNLDNPMLSHDSFTTWLASGDATSRSIAFKIGSGTDAEEFLHLAASAVRAYHQAWWATPSVLHFPETDELSVYASLIRQALIQQPRLFLDIFHIIPTIVDSIRGSYETWKTRMLWLCLRTLLYAPTHAPTYGFICIESSASIHVFNRINSALRTTETRYRLILALKGEQDPQVDLSTTLVVNPGLCYNLPRAATGILQEDPTIVEAYLLKLSSRDLGLVQWTLKGLIWIAFSIRPLTLEELDSVLFLENPDSPGSPGDLSTRLMQLLPGVVKCVSGRVFLTFPDAESQNLLSRLTKPLLLFDASPHIWIAQSCLKFLQGTIFTYVQADLDVQDLPMRHRAFAEYTARYWIKHYSLGNLADIKGNKSAFSDFVADDKNIQNWLLVIDRFSQLTSKTNTTTILDRDLRKHINLKSLDGLGIVQQLVMRSSSISGAGRLLVYAAERSNEKLLRSLCLDIDSIDQDAAITAAAVTNGTLHEEIMKAIDHILRRDETLHSRIQLQAQILGNRETADRLLSVLLNTTPNIMVDDWFSDALRAAVVYQDDVTLCRLLKRGDLVNRITWREAVRYNILHFAASAGDPTTMSKLLDAGFQSCINVLSPNGHSPLTIASSRGLLGIVRRLLSKEALVDLVGKSEKTALHIASQYGFLGTVTELLSKNPDIIAADSEGNYALHLAIANRMTKVAELLVTKFPFILEEEAASIPAANSPATEVEIEYYDIDAPIECNSNDSEDGVAGDNDDRYNTYQTVSAPLNRANYEGRTALIESAEQGMLSTAELLLQNGADPDILDDLHRTAIHLAAKVGALGISEALIAKGAALDLQGYDTKASPLHFSCYRGNLEASIQLVKAGANLEKRDNWGCTPLSAACISGHLPLVRSLLHWYKPEQWPESLVEASRYGHLEVAEHLLDMGCPVNAKTSEETTALLGASGGNQPKMVELLLLRGADVEAHGPDGQRAIHWAVEIGSFGITKLLVDRGADLDVEDSKGGSPLCNAIYFEYPKIVDLLLKRGAVMKPSGRWNHYNNLLDFSWGLSNPTVTKVLLNFYKQGRNDDGLTPAKALMVAINRESKRLTTLVLETWYNSDTTGDLSMGEAIHFAASQNNVELLSKLLDDPLGPPSINYELPGVGTPLHTAIRSKTPLQTVRLLLDKGADAENVSGIYGTTLNAACVRADIETVKLLLDHLPTKAASITGRYGTPMQSAVVGFQKETSDSIIAFLQFLEEKGMSPLVVGGMYCTPLHAALNPLFSVPIEVVSWLIKRASPSLRYIDNAGHLPLHLAILKGDWNLVSEILSYSSDSHVRQISFKDRQGLTGLHYASLSNPKLMANILRLDGIENLINQKDIDDWTPLHWACRQKNTEIVKALVERNADVTARTKEGWLPRQIAILHGNGGECLDMLPDIGGKGADLPVGRGAYFYAKCDVCNCNIFWKRYTCTSDDCDDVDLCFKCYSHAEIVHPREHEFHEIWT
ncbi:ankyrin repeat-containing domain protein [Xylaria telfairii]|nr:ankyrin repeat-containing domain protein [Xylaria telfairii]